MLVAVWKRRLAPRRSATSHGPVGPRPSAIPGLRMKAQKRTGRRECEKRGHTRGDPRQPAWPRLPPGTGPGPRPVRARAALLAGARRAVNASAMRGARAYLRAGAARARETKRRRGARARMAPAAVAGLGMSLRRGLQSLQEQRRTSSSGQRQSLRLPNAQSKNDERGCCFCGEVLLGVLWEGLISKVHGGQGRAKRVRGETAQGEEAERRAANAWAR